MKSSRFARDDNFTKPEGEKMPTYNKMGTVPFSHFFKEDRDCPLFRRMYKVSAYFMNNSG